MRGGWLHASSHLTHALHSMLRAPRSVFGQFYNLQVLVEDVASWSYLGHLQLEKRLWSGTDLEKDREVDDFVAHGAKLDKRNHDFGRGDEVFVRSLKDTQKIEVVEALCCLQAVFLPQSFAGNWIIEGLNLGPERLVWLWKERGFLLHLLTRTGISVSLSHPLAFYLCLSLTFICPHQGSKQALKFSEGDLDMYRALLRKEVVCQV